MEVPKTIGDFELIPQEDTLDVVNLLVNAETVDAISDIAKEKYEEFFDSLMLSTGSIINYQLLGATEITPNREKKESFEHVHASFHITAKVKVDEETRKKMWQEREDVFLLSQKHDQLSKKALAYFIIGMRLNKWSNESFLNFYKSIELISSRFIHNFNMNLKGIIPDLSDIEINRLRTPKRLFKHTCSELGVNYFDERIDKIVDIRNSEDVAHARSATPFKEEYVQPCKELAKKLVIAYLRSHE